MKNEHAVALGSIKSERKAQTARENGKLGGRPKKPMEIPLTQGKVALVDREDYAKLMKYKWYALKQRTGNFYAVRHSLADKNGKRGTILMHRTIINVQDGMEIDHVDGCGLNNTRANLRVCTHSQNLMNVSKTSSNTSGFKGVSFRKNRNKWLSRIQCDGKSVYLGLYDTPIEAYKARCEACIKYHREFARTK